MSPVLVSWAEFRPTCGGKKCVSEKRQPGQEPCAHHGLSPAGGLGAFAKWAQGDAGREFQIRSPAVTCQAQTQDPRLLINQQTKAHGVQTLGTQSEEDKPVASLVMGSNSKKTQRDM